MSCTRTCSHSASPDMSSSDPSALEAARHASADLDHSASNTVAGCEGGRWGRWGRGGAGTGSARHALQQTQRFAVDRKEFDSPCAHLTSHPDAAAFCDRRTIACCRRAWKQLVGCHCDDVGCVRLNSDAVTTQLRVILEGQRGEHITRDTAHRLSTARSTIKKQMEAAAAAWDRVAELNAGDPYPMELLL
jgi:hypothetical protein